MGLSGAQNQTPYVLQASVYEDFRTALVSGNQISNRDDLPSKDSNAEGAARNSNIFFQSTEDYCAGEYYLGISLAYVVTLLAEWVLLNGPSIDATSWHTPVPNDEIILPLSDFDIENFNGENCCFPISVCQHALIQHVDRQVLEGTMFRPPVALVPLTAPVRL